MVVPFLYYFFAIGSRVPLNSLVGLSISVQYYILISLLLIIVFILYHILYFYFVHLLLGFFSSLKTGFRCILQVVEEVFRSFT